MANQIKYDVVEHIISQQIVSEENFLAEFRSAGYPVNNPLVKLNPYLIAPLTAMLMFNTSEAVSVDICVKGKEAAGDMRHSFPAATEHILPIYGLYVDYLNTVELTLSNGEKHIVMIQTETAHESLKFATYINTTPEYMDGNLMALTVARNAHPAAYDYAGDCRWYSPINLCWDLKRISNGHFLIGSDRYVGAPYYTSGIVEMGFSGKIFKEYRVPGGYHHDHWEMEDGSLLILTQDLNSSTVEDMCVQVDRETGAILKTWDYKTVLPQDVAGSGSQDELDWFHNNAVWYDKKTHSLTLSGRHQDVVINIDFETGELNWIIGDPEGWPQEMVDKYFFTPVGDGDFDWQYEQHACLVCPDGDIMCFDNGHFRAKSPDNYVLGKDNFSRGVRYRINTEDMTIEQVWQYGKERGNEFFSPYICNVEYYGESHYMTHSGGIAFIEGETPEGLGSRLAMQRDDVELKSITVETIGEEVVYELHVPANYYRAEKLKLYYEGEVAELGKGNLLGVIGGSLPTRMKIKCVETNELIPENYGASITEEIDRIKFNATFEANEMAQLLLTHENGDTIRFTIPTAEQDFSAMCIGTFQKADPKNADLFISKNTLASGKYTMQVVCGEEQAKLYETGIVIEV